MSQHDVRVGVVDPQPMPLHALEGCSPIFTYSYTGVTP